MKKICHYPENSFSKPTIFFFNNCNINVTKEEIKNCKDYKTAQKIVTEWNREDEDYLLSLDDFDGKMYYWMVGFNRTRLTRRRAWDEMKPYPKYSI